MNSPQQPRTPKQYAIHGFFGVYTPSWGYVLRLGLWFLMILVLWAPAEWLFLRGLELATAPIFDSAATLAQRQLSAQLLLFRRLLEPAQILTKIWQGAVASASAGISPDLWRAKALEGFAAFPPGSVDLLVTDGKHILPAFPGYNPDLLGSFLASMTARSASLDSTLSAIKYLRQTQAEIQGIGYTRFSVWQWIPLPIFPGISNRAFDYDWYAHHLNFVMNTPRNTWAAFGPLPDRLDDWRYLLLIHRQALPENFLSTLAQEEAHRIGLPVSLGRFGEAYSENASSRMMESAIRSNLDLKVHEEDEIFGKLEAFTALPRELGRMRTLGNLANIFLSCAFFILAWKFAGGSRLEELKANQKIRLGLIIAGGLPVLLALISIEGAVGAHIFRQIQTRQMEMEQGIQVLEMNFETYLDGVKNDYRRALKQFPLNQSQLDISRWGEHLAGLHQAANIHLFKENGQEIFARGPFPWTPYRLSSLPPEERSRQLIDRIRRGYFLRDHELDMIGLDATGTIPLSESARRRILFQWGRKKIERPQFALYQMFAKMVCQAVNREGVATVDPASQKTDVLLNIALMGREKQFLQEGMTALGTLAQFKIPGFQSMTFPEVIKDADGKARYFILIFHRLSILSEQFLERFFKGTTTKKQSITFAALSLEPAKPDYGFALPEPISEGLRQSLKNPGRTLRFILPNASGEPCLISAMCGSRMSDFIFVVSFPLREIAESALHLQMRLGGVLVFLILLLAGVALLIRFLLLSPLSRLKDGVNAIATGKTEHPLLEASFGEMNDLADLFNQALANLRNMDVARLVQENFLPQKPVEIGEFKIYGTSKMMSKTGGDYFDIISQNPEQLLLVIGDVSGHGLPAAIVMSMVKSGLSLLAPMYEMPADLCAILNIYLQKTLARKLMMTCFLASLNHQNGALAFCNAGHNFPLHLKAGLPGTYLQNKNLPLGSLKRPYKQDSLVLHPGDMLIMYTDGVVETRDPAGNFMSYDRFREYVDALPRLSSQQMAQDILDFVARYSEGSPMQDDVTVFVIQRTNFSDPVR